MHKKILLNGSNENDLSKEAINTLSMIYGPKIHIVGTHPKDDKDHANDCRFHQPTVIVFYKEEPSPEQRTFEGVRRAVLKPGMNKEYDLKFLPDGQYII